MSKTPPSSPLPDQLQRAQALDPTSSVLVQAPAGSGKTTLLTERFLTLLAEVDDPGQVVAITFTNAAAAEMRNRILDELRNPEPSPIALRALDHSNARGWNLLDLPAQLRISTIDSFCRDLALQQPLLSGLGGGLAIGEQPDGLYRRAARRALEQIGEIDDPVLGRALEELFKWRDNNWLELEDLLVEMLSTRDRWMHEFVLSHYPDWEALRQRLERPFANAVRDSLAQVSQLLDQVPGAREEALLLARIACANPNGEQHRPLAELAEFPLPPFPTLDALEEAHQALVCLANLLLTLGCTFRKVIDKNLGFPSDRKPEKARLLKLISDLSAVSGLDAALTAFRGLPPLRYTEDDWLIVRACFTLLRQAAAQLKVVFAETAAVDFIEVAQIALSVLKSDDGFPTDAAFAVADGIRHLLVDEFQDTSRRQHQLLAGIIAAWPDRAGRTLFAVGDPMQSVYFFRDADAELFARVKEFGLEVPNAEPMLLEFVSLTANFRTTPQLVVRLNEAFVRVFAQDDGSGVGFSPAQPARGDNPNLGQCFELHINFSPQTASTNQQDSSNVHAEESSQEVQIQKIVELIRTHLAAIEESRGRGEKYRLAVLARTRSSLAPIAQALREAAIPFRALDLEKLAARPEVLDALALARALLNPEDRVAWLGVLRAPWCGLTVADLHILTSADDSEILSRPIPGLLAERLPLLSEAGSVACQRVLSALASVSVIRAGQSTASPGTWLQQVWLSLGGAACCDATARANLDLLWNCLDGLPAGQQDLLGPALEAALGKLTALPDPNSTSDCGVQLMTIHKSKGLEFEVVIVPELQARTAGGKPKLLSWLERGIKPESGAALDEHDGAEDITEFLIAPLQPKGDDRGKSKAWVDRVYRQRESQETRRILYVAATRARDALHLFARPTYKVESDGDFSLVNPSTSLLATAWPAFEEEIRARFEDWKAARQPAAGIEESQPKTAEAAEAEIESLAASAESNLLVMPSAWPPAAKPTLLRRLPSDYRHTLGALPFPRFSAERVGDPPASPPRPALSPAEAGRVPQVSLLRPGRPQLYARHEGGLVSRSLGIAVHAFFEELARLRTKDDWQTARASLEQQIPRIATQIRASGIAPSQAAQIAAHALQLSLNASQDPIAQWILSPQPEASSPEAASPEAASEIRWTGVVGSALTNVQVDRVFRAGLVPQSEGRAAWWIIDYKTAHAEAIDPQAALSQLRPIFAPQLEAYAKVLRNLHGADAVIRAGLYYPRLLLLDWWDL
jgi:ATP-dependent exoDNAse (exonuclease V) beta subunit